MCLFAKAKQTNRFYNKKRKNNEKYFTVYKVVRVVSDTISSIHFPYKWQPGFNKPITTCIDKKITFDSIIYEGIHVFLTKAAAKRYYRSGYCFKYRLIPVKVYLSDLIGVGHKNKAVFKKVFLKKIDYNKGGEEFVGN